jgi:hypothetical protein
LESKDVERTADRDRVPWQAKTGEGVMLQWEGEQKQGG